MSEDKIIILEFYNTVTDLKIVNSEKERKNEMIIKCPECNSNNVFYGPSSGNKFPLSSWVVAFLFLVYPFHKKKFYHCFNCRNEFSLK